ncbi:MAG: hypothetical protein ABL918_12340, partial [Chakrabartia sp.]
MIDGRRVWRQKSDEWKSRNSHLPAKRSAGLAGSKKALIAHVIVGVRTEQVEHFPINLDHRDWSESASNFCFALTRINGKRLSHSEQWRYCVGEHLWRISY